MQAIDWLHQGIKMTSEMGKAGTTGMVRCTGEEVAARSAVATWTAGFTGSPRISERSPA